MALGRCTVVVAQRYTDMAELQMMDPDQTGDWDDAEEQDVRPVMKPNLAHLHLRLDMAHFFTLRPRFGPGLGYDQQRMMPQSAYRLVSKPCGPCRIWKCLHVT